MKRILTAAALALGLAAFATAQTATPTNTPTPTQTPTPTATPTVTPQQLANPVTLVVPSGATTSNEVLLNPDMRADLTIYVPGTIDGTVTVEVADAIGGTFRTLQTLAGADVALAAGKAVPIGPVIAATLRIKEGTTAAAARTFIVAGKMYVR